MSSAENVVAINQPTLSLERREAIKTIVRSSYDLQKLRMQFGNRIVSNFKQMAGQDPAGMAETELEKEAQSMLAKLRKDYNRITDGIVESGIESSLPTLKKFKSVGMIDTYTKLVLVHQYMAILKNEEDQFSRLDSVLSGVPLYEGFLKNTPGVGPALSGIILSEMDIYKAKYPSSFWKFAGLDSVEVVEWVDGKGKVVIETIEDFGSNPKNTLDQAGNWLARGMYETRQYSMGRSKKDYCLVKKEYIKSDGSIGIKDSITFNPLVKTKLVGVLGGSFLKQARTFVDGAAMSTKKRKELAIEEGYLPAGGCSAAEEKESVLTFLSSYGHDVTVSHGEYAQHYYNYKNRLDNHPKHANKTKLHKHNMAIRFMIKRFLVDLHREWSLVEGITPTTEYSVGKLGYAHGLNPNNVM